MYNFLEKNDVNTYSGFVLFMIWFYPKQGKKQLNWNHIKSSFLPNFVVSGGVLQCFFELHRKIFFASKSDF
jgi:hypothetical protein